MRGAYFKSLATGALVALQLTGCGSAPEPRPEPLQQAERFNEFGFDAFAAGRYTDAARYFREAERQFFSIDDPAGTARAAISVAEVALLLNDFESAVDAIKRADMAVRHGGDAAEGLRQRVRLLKARFAYAQGNNSAALRLLEDIDAAGPLAQHAALLNCQMELDDGGSACAFALTAPEEDRLMRARIERLRAQAALRDGRRDAAGTHLDRALEIYRAAVYRPGLAAVYEMRGRMLADEDRDAARRMLERALFLRAWIQDRQGFMETLERLGQIAESEQDRRRYRKWREQLGEDPGTGQWETVMETMFSQR